MTLRTREYVIATSARKVDALVFQLDGRNAIENGFRSNMIIQTNSIIIMMQRMNVWTGNLNIEEGDKLVCLQANNTRRNMILNQDIMTIGLDVVALRYHILQK